MFKFINALFKSKGSYKNILNANLFKGENYGVSDLLLYGKLIDENIILQTDGSLLVCFWYEGSDLETSTDEELSLLSDKLNNAFNLLGSGWMFHVDVIRYYASDYIKEDACYFSTKISSLIDEERRNLYLERKNHFENCYAINFTYKPKIDFANKVGIFFTNNDKANDNVFDYNVYLKKFKAKISELVDLLSYEINITVMNTRELLSYINWCLTGDIVNLNIPSKNGFFLKHFLATNDLIGGDSVRSGDKYIKTVTIMGFPQESYPGILNQLNTVDFEYRFNSRFIFLNQFEADKIIDKLSNLWYQKRISASDTMKMSLNIDTNIKINQYAQMQYLESQNAKLLNDSNDAKFGYYTATVVIMDENEAIANENAKFIRALFRNLGFQSQIERHHGLEAFLGSLPGFAYANIRKWLIHTMNVADIIPTTSIWSGLDYNPCSLYKDNNPPLFYANTTGNTPLRLSLHVNDNGHTLIIGPTGSGKSTLINFIVAQQFRYKYAKVIIFDKNYSCLPICYASCGKLFDIGADNFDNYFQPLRHLDTDLDFDFAWNWIEELCILNGMQNSYNETHRQAIIKALKLLQATNDIERRTLEYYRLLVQDYDKTVSTILENFTNSFNNGFVNKLFNGHRDLLTNSDNFTVFEMGKLMNLGERIIIPALKYLIHTISKSFDSNYPTLLVFDESFIFFNHDIFRAKIIEWIKLVRKFNVAIIFATHELMDFFRYEELLSTIKSNCATKIFLGNKLALTSETYNCYKSMDLNDKQIATIANMNKGEYFYFSELGKRKFTLELNKNQITYAFTARTSNEDIKNAKLLYLNDKEHFIENWINYCIGNQK